MKNLRSNNGIVKDGILPRSKSRPFHQLEELGLDTYLFETVSVAQSELQEFFQDSELDLIDVLAPAFGTNVDETALAGLVSQISAGDFSSLPTFEVRTSEELQDANGVYVAALDTIYVSEAFLQTASQSELVALLLEEMGHAIDATINETDSAGDEGNIFANLVLGVEMTEAELAALYAEDDSLTLTIDGEVVEAEAASTREGTDGDDRDYGTADDDYIEGGYGDDTLHGDNGDDTIKGGDDDDEIKGEDGHDILKGGKGKDDIEGGPGNDTIDGGSNSDAISGDSGDDKINGGESADSIEGGAGDDTIEGNDGADSIEGGDDDDILKGGGSADTIKGGAGDDTIEGNGGADSIEGGDGADFIEGNDGADSIEGGDGADFIEGDDGADSIEGGDGADFIEGNDGADSIEGGAGDDILKGGDGADTIKGGAGADFIFTGDLSKGSSDYIEGGSGADTFFMGESTSGSTIQEGGYNWVNSTGDLTKLALTTAIVAAGKSNPVTQASLTLVKDVVPSIIGLISNQQSTSRIEDATKSNYAQINDFNPLEDVVIIPFASSGDPNVSLGDGDGINDLIFNYAANTNGATKFGGLNFDSGLNLGSTAQAFYQQSLIDTALVINSDGVQYGGDQSVYALTDGLALEPEVRDQLSGMSGGYMILGAYSGQVIEGDNTGNNLYGTNHADVFYGYSPNNNALGITYAPQGDVADYMYGFGGDDFFYGGNGDNYIYGGDNKWGVYDDSDTVSYQDATAEYNSTQGITVHMIEDADSDDNGEYFDVEHSFVSNSGVGGTDRLYDIENIIGTEFSDTITGDGKDNTFIGLGGNDELSGGSGQDTLDGGEGNDFLDGGSDDDTAAFSGNMSDYSFTTDGAYLYVTDNVGTDGTDTLTDVETLQFADTTLGADSAPLYAAMYSIYTPVNRNDWTLVGASNTDSDNDDDLLWRNNSNGYVAVWDIEDNAFVSGYNLWGQTNPGNNWTLIGGGDFDTRDNDRNLVWRNSSTGVAHAWTFDDRQYEGNGYHLWDGAGVSSDWTLVDAGDLDGDGDEDLIWQHDSSYVHAWEMHNGQREGGYNILGGFKPGNDWTVVGAGDLDADGDDDIIWQRDDGLVNMWEMEGGDYIYTHELIAASNFESDWNLVGAGDFNGNGRDDLLLQDNAGQVFAIDSSTLI